MKTCYDLGKEMTEMKYKALPIGVSDFSWSYMAGRWELAYEKNCFYRKVFPEVCYESLFNYLKSLLRNVISKITIILAPAQIR